VKHLDDVRTAQRIGSALAWTQADPVLAEGEIGVEGDTNRFKIGNGISPWHLLKYFLDEDGVEALITDFLADFEGGTLDPRIGDLNDLSTTVKSSIVASINDVNTTLVPLRSLYNNAKAG
jgi:hypothetical protein